MIFFAVGADPWTAPADGWQFIEITTKTNLRITLPREIAAGSVVFFNACWLSPTLERGPMGDSPRSIRVMDGLGSAGAIAEAA